MSELTSLIGEQKPPCKFPQLNGERCCECACCQITAEEMWAWVHEGREPVA